MNKRHERLDRHRGITTTIKRWRRGRENCQRNKEGDNTGWVGMPGNLFEQYEIGTDKWSIEGETL